MQMDSTSAASASSSQSAPAQSQSKAANTHAAAASAHAATKQSAITLHTHALQSVFAFIALHNLCAGASHVNRAWHSAAQSMPSVRAWLRLSQLDEDELGAVSRALTTLSIIRQANGSRKRLCFKNMRNRLRTAKCLTASKQLRALFDSVQIVSKEVEDKIGRACMRFTLPCVVAAAASSAASSSSLPPSAVPVTVDLSVSFDVDNRELDEYSMDHTHSIELGRTSLMHFYRQESNDDERLIDSAYHADGLLSWLRSLGVMRGNRRQQIALLEVAIRTLFDLCDSRHSLWWNKLHSEACEQAYDGVDPDPEQQPQPQPHPRDEDPEVPEEAEDDQDDKPAPRPPRSKVR